MKSEKEVERDADHKAIGNNTKGGRIAWAKPAKPDSMKPTGKPLFPNLKDHHKGLH